MFKMSTRRFKTKSRCLEIDEKTHEKNSEEEEIQMIKKIVKEKVKVPLRVVWNNQTQVRYIPCRDDHFVFGSCDELWWKRTDFIQFKNDAVVELVWIMKTHHLDVKTATQYIYQGGPLPRSLPLPMMMNNKRITSPYRPESPSMVTRSFSIDESTSFEDTMTSDQNLAFRTNSSFK
jgi:hypothetical protein